MAWQSFATLAAGNEPLGLFDVLTAQIAPCVLIPCTASGSTAIALTGTANAPALGAYSDLVSFSFIAAGNAGGPVTAQFGGLTALPAYYQDGVTQVGAGGVLLGLPYTLTYSAALNLGGGGFYLGQLAKQTVAAAAINRGYNAALNLQINATVASGVLTVAVKDGSTGNDASNVNPIGVTFRNASIASGAPANLNIQGALSVSTFAIGATLGVPNGVPFRLWLVVLNNGGTPVLALWHSGAAQATPAINPQLNNEAALQSAVAFTAGATSAGVFYCPNGTTVTSQAFRVLGYMDFAAVANLSGLGFNAPPTTIQLFGPGVKKPGDVLQTQQATSTTPTSVNTSVRTITNTVLSIAPTSASNLVRARVSGNLTLPPYNNASCTAGAQMARSNAATAPSNLFGTLAVAVHGSTATSGATQHGAPCTLEGYDAPGTPNSTQYSVYTWSRGGNGGWLGTLQGDVSQAQMTLEEIMA